MKAYHELKLKSIDELIIPEQLQAIVHIIYCLAHNQCDELLKSEIFEFINHSASNFTTISYVLNIFSEIFPKNCSSYWKIYESIKSKYNCYDFNPQKLHIKEYDEIFPAQSIENLVAWDKPDDFIIELEKETIDINQKVGGMSLIDTACKYGSEKCFSYLKLKGAAISDKSFIYAVEGGCRNILLDLWHNYSFEITDDHLAAALKYHHNCIFDWLLETKGSIDRLKIAECFYYGNITGLLFLIENGFGKTTFDIIRILFIISMLHSSITFVYHYYKTFINHICLSLL